MWCNKNNIQFVISWLAYTWALLFVTRLNQDVFSDQVCLGIILCVYISFGSGNHTPAQPCPCGLWWSWFALTHRPSNIHSPRCCCDNTAFSVFEFIVGWRRGEIEWGRAWGGLEAWERLDIKCSENGGRWRDRSRRLLFGHAFRKWIITGQQCQVWHQEPLYSHLLRVCVCLLGCVCVCVTLSRSLSFSLNIHLNQCLWKWKCLISVQYCCRSLQLLILPWHETFLYGLCYYEWQFHYSCCPKAFLAPPISLSAILLPVHLNQDLSSFYITVLFGHPLLDGNCFQTDQFELVSMFLIMLHRFRTGRWWWLSGSKGIYLFYLRCTIVLRLLLIMMYSQLVV